MDYKGLYVAIGYRGKELGHVMSGGGHVRAKGLSYVETRVEFVRVEVVRELIYLVEDLAKGFIKFDTLTQVDGSFGLSFFQVPLKVSNFFKTYYVRFIIIFTVNICINIIKITERK